jgi:YegS/Rv2252/BmrU family lipid kinase
MTRKIPLIIINPTAGGGSGGRDWERAVASIRTHFGHFTCTFTEASGDAARIAEEESRAGRQFIIAFGGDGTISEVARGILESGADAELGVLPHGTGSDFIRTLKTPTRLADAARSLREGHRVRIDVGEVTYHISSGESQSRYFINSASFGLSGEVTKRTNRSSKRFGGLISFASSTMKTAFAFEHPHVYLEVDDEPSRRLPVTTVCINNGCYFGGGMKIAPEASLVDGRLDLIVVRKLSFFNIVTKGPRLYGGAHLGLPEVHHQLATSARAWPVNPNDKVLLEVDGESPGELPASFEVRPKALLVRVPEPVPSLKLHHLRG